ncbi:MAG: carbohydrate kinase family protein, partial [Candidatus Limnocylindrales bacterium]
MDARTRPLIVTLGDLIVDVVAAAAGPLAYGSDRAGSVALRQGGSAANTARWIVASGGQAVFIGAVGRDEWARRLAASLTRAGVVVHAVGKAAPTARIVAIVEPGGERTFVTDRGAADLLVASDLRPRWFAGAVGLHLPAYSLYNRPLASAALRAVQLARAAGAMVSVDLASRQPILDLGPGEAWSRIASVTPDVLFANASEAEAILEGRTERALLDLAAIVVVKRGGTGCRVLARPVSPRAIRSPGDVGRASLVLDVPTAPVQVRDTTGAGDAFAAGFLVRLLAREPGTRHTRR